MYSLHEYICTMHKTSQMYNNINISKERVIKIGVLI